ncbi:hypothetical protein BJV82DRAFT_691272 [Fennellomyces sp. T-0311]|nr:hypothetical protein BJV82DRAFT_691272 [Fennellomyces sp. T-0311]
MAFFKKKYSTITSKLRDNTNIIPYYRPGFDSIDKAQLAAQKIIRRSPASAHGYLVSGQLYEQKNNLQAALNVYKQGLRFVPPDNAQHATLKKEKASISITLVRRSTEFLPYDILCLIFGYLEFCDLIRCSQVCQAWYDFIIHWPEFWRRLSTVIPQIQRSTIDSVVRRQIQEFRLDGPVDTQLVADILKLLTDSDNHLLKKLIFSKLTLTMDGAKILAEAIRWTSPPVKQVEFIDCRVPDGNFLGPILEACSSLTDVSFSQTVESQIAGSGIPVPRKKSIIAPKFKLSLLTSLKLSAIYLSESSTAQISGILRQCPSLIHLFLDSRAPIHHGYCMRQALKFCPYLETLVFSKSAEMPETLTTAPIEPAEPTRVSSNHKRLRRFVFVEESFNHDLADIPLIMEKSYRTLEYLYLHYNGLYALETLALFGAPRLRELHLFPENCTVGSYSPNSVSEAFSFLFRYCPVLEVIEISDTLENGYNMGYFIVDDHVLQSIAKHCPKIRRLKLVGCNYHKRDAILDFATVGASQLACLEIDMDPHNAQALVDKVPSLKQLHIREDNQYYTIGTPIYDLQNVKRVLQQRGGSLKFRNYS